MFTYKEEGNAGFDPHVEGQYLVQTGVCLNLYTCIVFIWLETSYLDYFLSCFLNSAVFLSRFLVFIIMKKTHIICLCVS